MLRGFMDHRITKHTTIEQLISTDIDHWIANLYIQVGFILYFAIQKESKLNVLTALQEHIITFFKYIAVHFENPK